MTDHENAKEHAAGQEKVLSLRGLWWIPLLVVLAMLAMLLRLFIPVAESGLDLHVDTDLSLADYGYTLEPCLVDGNSLVSSGLPRDQIHSLSDPPTVIGSEVPAINKLQRRRYHRKFIVSGDRVIGVSLNGESRAYQINILNYHEIINDTLGGVPIVVVYSPLCDAATVFKREVGGEVRSFGSSGLLLNSNIVMYDRQEDLSQSSLWSQLQFRAIAGPAAELGLELELLPAALTHWGEWVVQHPDTTLLSNDTGEPREYNSNPYLRYFEMQKLRFPVDPLPPLATGGVMDRIIALRVDNRWVVYSFDDIRQAAGESASVEFDGLHFEYIPFSHTMDPPGVVVTDASGKSITTVSSFWFAWYAMYPDTRILDFP